MKIELKYDNYTLKGELIGESNQPVYDKDGTTLLYIKRTLQIVPEDGPKPIVVETTKDK